MLKLLVISSMENSTPPIGAPKATATPAALDAVSISLIFPTQDNLGCVGLYWRFSHPPWLLEKRANRPATTLPTQHAMCTEGPSLPTESPDAMTRGWVSLEVRAGECQMDKGTYESQALDYERPETKESFHNEACEDTLDFRDS